MIPPVVGIRVNQLHPCVPEEATKSVDIQPYKLCFTTKITDISRDKSTEWSITSSRENGQNINSDFVCVIVIL